MSALCVQPIVERVARRWLLLAGLAPQRPRLGTEYAWSDGRLVPIERDDDEDDVDSAEAGRPSR